MTVIWMSWGKRVEVLEPADEVRQAMLDDHMVTLTVYDRDLDISQQPRAQVVRDLKTKTIYVNREHVALLESE